MSDRTENLDLNLWLDRDFQQRYNRLKAEFWEILGAAGDSISIEELSKTHPNPKGKKLSKGNDLLGFPYQVLDLVRDFDFSIGMNIRVLNWFGHGMFILVLIGKNSFSAPQLNLVEIGFSLGLTISPWDYPELILESTYTGSPGLEQMKALSHFQWIKSIPIAPEKNLVITQLSTEIKKVLDCLSQKMG